MAYPPVQYSYIQGAPQQRFPAPAVVPVSKVQLRISCKDLMRKDVLSKSDPMVVVHMQHKTSRRFTEVGRTEQIKNCHDPQFSTPVLVDYFFEEVQKMKFTVYDIDSPKEELHSADFLGSIETNLSQIVAISSFTRELGHPSGNCGTITIFSEEISDSKEFVQLSFRGHKLDKKDFLGKSDPYLEFYKMQADGNVSLVHRTEVKNNTLNPVWLPFEVSVQELCGGDYNRNIKVDCFDWDKDGGHDLIGTFTTTMNEMLKAVHQEVSFPCINPKKQNKKKHYTNSGIIYLNRCQVRTQYSFLDYIKGGCQINFTVAVDFTASNGDPNHPSSLHYINPYEPNEYTKALLAVGEVCQDYDTDKLFPCLGFGAMIPPKFEVHFEFPLNFDWSNPYCNGLNGILEAYQGALRQIRLYGPTNFAPVINHVARFARDSVSQGAKNYFILLIITDGAISDLDYTKKAIIEASHFPMSIIIVGVGSADFSSMEVLDADKEKLSAFGKDAVRDIVQFVPFRDFKEVHPSLLAKSVLAEVPKQVTEYFMKKNILPGGS